MEYSRNIAGILNLANNSDDERRVTAKGCLKWYIYVIELNSVLFFLPRDVTPDIGYRVTHLFLNVVRYCS